MSKIYAVILAVLGILISLAMVSFAPGFKDGLIGYLGVIASVLFIIFGGGDKNRKHS